jgi:hypothetical protein
MISLYTLLSVLLLLLVALLPQLYLSKPKKEKRQSRRKIRNLNGFNIDTLTCSRYHILYLSSIVQKGLINRHDIGGYIWGQDFSPMYYDVVDHH